MPNIHALSADVILSRGRLLAFGNAVDVKESLLVVLGLSEQQLPSP